MHSCSIRRMHLLCWKGAAVCSRCFSCAGGHQIFDLNCTIPYYAPKKEPERLKSPRLFWASPPPKKKTRNLGRLSCSSPEVDVCCTHDPLRPPRLPTAPRATCFADPRRHHSVQRNSAKVVPGGQGERRRSGHARCRGTRAQHV